MLYIPLEITINNDNLCRQKGIFTNIYRRKQMSTKMKINKGLDNIKTSFNIQNKAIKRRLFY